MANYKDDLLALLSELGEEPIALSVALERGECMQKASPTFYVFPTDLSVLDYEYDDGFGGGADCHPIYCWTEHFVIITCEYDGSTQLKAVPRAPSPAGTPDFY